MIKRNCAATSNIDWNLPWLWYTIVPMCQSLCCAMVRDWPVMLEVHSFELTHAVIMLKTWFTKKIVQLVCLPVTHLLWFLFNCPLCCVISNIWIWSLNSFFFLEWIFFVGFFCHVIGSVTFGAHNQAYLFSRCSLQCIHYNMVRRSVQCVAYDLFLNWWLLLPVKWAPMDGGCLFRSSGSFFTFLQWATLQRSFISPIKRVATIANLCAFDILTCLSRERSM